MINSIKERLPIMTEPNKRKLAIAGWGFYLAGLFIFYLIWTINQPFDAAPDEAMRYDIPKFIYETGALPHGGDEAIRDEIWGISYAFNPILSYIIAAAFMKVTSIFSTGSFALLMSARMVSVLFGVGTAFFTIKIAKKLLPAYGRLLFVVMVTLLPQAAYLCSYVNNDSMALCSTAALIYAWILGIETNWNKKSCVGLALAISLCALSYYNAYGFILCSILLFSFTALFCQQKRLNFRFMWTKGCFIAIIVLVCIGWWFIRNAVIYNGDFLGRSTMSRYSEQYAMTGFKPSDHYTHQKAGESLYHMLVRDKWLRLTKFSFIGIFGYMEHSLPLSMYDRYLYPIYVGIVGMIVQLPKRLRLHKEGEWLTLNLLNYVLILAMAITAGLSIWYSYASDFQAQGRYVMPMLIPMMYFVVLGISKILEFFIKKQRLWWITSAYALYLVMSAIQAYIQVFYPAYH